MVLGGFGFIGLNMIEVLHKKYQLVIINRNPNTHFIEKYNLKYYAIDVLTDDIKSIFDIEKPNYIINNISIVDTTLNLSVFPKMIDTNLSILLKIFEASKTLSSLEAVIHLGSMEEYGILQKYPPPTKIYCARGDEGKSYISVCHLQTTNNQCSNNDVL